MKGLIPLTPAQKNSMLWISIVVIVGTSIGLEWHGRACGFNVTSDSVQYLASAESFKTQGKFLGDDGTYNPYWPPLFPVLLSLTSDPLTLLSVINVCCKIIIGLLLFSLSANFLTSAIHRIVFAAISMLSVHMLMISVFVWTELVFLTLMLLNLYFIVNRERRFFFAGIIVTGFLLCLQRNAGLFYVVGVSTWWLLSVEASLTKKVRESLIILLLSTSGLWAWNSYNTFLLPADFVFYDRPWFDGFFANIMVMMGGFVKMIAPVQQAWVQAFIFLVVVGCVFFLLKPFSKNLLVMILITYTGGFLVLGKLDGYEIDRYLSVMAPIVFLVLLMAVERIQLLAPQWMRVGLMVGVLVILSYNLIRTGKNVQSWHQRSCLTESSR